jgi:hypothetical protein
VNLLRSASTNSFAAGVLIVGVVIAVCFVGWSLRLADAKRDPITWGSPRAPAAALFDENHEVEFSIPFANNASVPIPVAFQTASCACTKLESLPNPIPPGFIGTLKGKIRIPAREHKVRLLVSIGYSRSSNSFVHEDVVQINCRRPVETQSSRLELSGPNPAATGFYIRHFRLKDDPEFAPVAYSFRGDHIRIKESGDWRLLPDQDGFCVRERELRIESEVPTGGAELLIRDTSKGMGATLSVPILWSSSARVEVFPTSFVMQPSSITEMDLTVQSQGNRTIEIVDLRAPHWIQAVNTSTGAKARHELRFRLGKDRPARPTTASIAITIRSDNKDERLTVMALFLPNGSDSSQVGGSSNDRTAAATAP